VISSLDQAISLASGLSRRVIAVAAAQDREILAAVKKAISMGFVRSLLVGDEREIRRLCEEIGLDSEMEIVNKPDPREAALFAAETVRRGDADVLLKGGINSADFMKAALDQDRGLRSGRLLSHVAAFDIPGAHKLVFHSDGGLIIAPSLDEKEGIIRNAVEAARSLGVEVPKVAVLSANEKPTPKMPSTTDALALVDRWKAGAFPPCVVEGPMAMDVAASGDAADRKGIKSEIAGDVDVFIVPCIEAGNLLGKALVYYAGARIAGFIAGAAKPIVMVSRSDNAQAKVDSMALACLVAGRGSR
jgi:phosphate butyryltransferase